MVRGLPLKSTAKKNGRALHSDHRSLALGLCVVVLVTSSFLSFNHILELIGQHISYDEDDPLTAAAGDGGLIPEEEQSTIYDYNYSTINHGQFVDGKWKSQRNQSEIPPLFMDRLNRYLPECPPIMEPEQQTNYTPCDNNHTRLFPEDVEGIERELLKFNIPHKIVIVLPENAEYVSLQHWRWNLLIDTLNKTLGTRKMCPNCHLRYVKGHFTAPNLTVEPAHVRIYPGGCHGYRDLDETTKRDFPDQVLVGDCGESQAGSGRQYWSKGLDKVDYDMSFVDNGSPFVRTYAHLHLSPDKIYNQDHNDTTTGLKPLHNVTDFVKQLLTTPVPSFPRHIHNQEIRQLLVEANNSTTPLEEASSNYHASFIHGACGHYRGSFLKGMIASEKETGVKIARYGKCFHNIDTQALMGDDWWEEKSKKFHADSEGHRDASKTVLASHHKFGFALENTLSPYYFTEKRWQVLLAASVPIVWDNHNSIQYLPDPDAALLVPISDPSKDRRELPKETAKKIHYYSQPENEQEYQDTFFAWKQRGLRPDFVRKLFLSSDFVLCRICEYMAHHHFYGQEHEEA